jgi:hypothetical protein
MRKTIWKYVLQGIDSQTVGMPKGAQILTVQTQGAAMCLWALVDPTQPIEHRIIDIIGTGWDAEDFTNRRYIGSAQMAHGALVWHVFERTN